MHTSWIVAVSFAVALTAQESPPDPGREGPAPATAPAPVVFAEFPVADPEPLDVDSASRQAVAGLLRLAALPQQEAWPYEGVYREDGGELPVGYRVGGTAIVCLGLMAAPGLDADAARRQAIERGVRFVLRQLDEPRMQIDFIGAYDVRGWGHVYALQLLLHLHDRGLVPDELADEVGERTRFLVRALVESAIPRRGGWNYSRPAGYRSPRNAASTFMTAPALLSLFHARARGHEVPDEVVDQALAALERARAHSGAFAYGAPAKSRAEDRESDLAMMDRTPGAVARNAACELVLALAGRADEARLLAAIEQFFAHWDELAKRKSRTGTHVPPYGVAPYYFLFGHAYCAFAIERLGEPEQREQLRRRLERILWRSRDADGTWNDRQFPRSAAYGTAMALWTLHAAALPLEPWRSAGAK